MVAEDFVSRKRASWERLTTLLNRAQTRLSNLSAQELQELGQLYRQVTSDLAVARRDFPRHPVSDYLNSLAARAHGEVYKGKSTRLSHIITFFTHTFPHTFRETWAYTLAALLMFLIPAIISFITAYNDPDTISRVLPGFQDILFNIKNENEWWQRINEEGRAASASFIMTNNIQVTFIAFAGGVTMGLLTFWVLVQNGILFGSITGAAQLFGFGDNLWGFVAAHAPIELSVIFIAGGAGLQLGWSLVRPGLLARRTALLVAARRAALLLFGCVPLLVIAGAIEGFISPAPLPVTFKIFVSIVSGLLLYIYLFLSGRPKTARPKNPISHH